MNFVQYVRSFYGPGGIYDMGATDVMIIEATVQYINSGADFAGDSFDRENVRDIMCKQYSLVPV
jgi:hypothetical protein